MWFFKKKKKVNKSERIPDLHTCSYSSKSNDESDENNTQDIGEIHEDVKPFFLMDWANKIEPNDLKKVQDALIHEKNNQIEYKKDDDQSGSVIPGKYLTSLATPTKGLRMDTFIKQSSLRHMFEKTSLESPSHKEVMASINSEEEAIRNAKLLNRQSLAFARSGEYLKAIGLWTQSLQILVSIYGEFHSEVALIMNNMGITYGKLNLNEESMQMLQESLFIRKELYGPYHLDVAATLHNIGNLLLSMGRFKESLNAYLETIDIRIRLLGRDHKEVAFSHNGIGHAYYEMGKYHEAHDEFLDALQIATNAGLSKNDPVVKDTIDGLDLLEDLLMH